MRDATGHLRRGATRAARIGAALALQHAGRPAPDRAFYNSFTGRFSDNPRGIYDELARRGCVREHTWVAAPPSDAFPPGVVRVAPFGWRYLEQVGRAGLVVSNVQMPRNFRKRPGTIYLQTWHGTPLKRIGYDNERWARNPGGFRAVRRDIAKWDFLVTQNRFSSETFRRAFGYEGEILEEGYPRNDVLVRPGHDEIRRRVRAELGIESHKTVVLYAPTWRDTLVDDQGRLGFSLALDVDAIARALGGDHVVLLRLHYLIAATLADAYGSVARNVSGVPDIRELYLAADVLITDYSSAMFDFAVTGKPVLFFVYDLDAYRDETRGFYLDFEAEAPGPLCRDTEDVVAALSDLEALRSAYADRSARFRRRYCPHDDGRAAERIVDRVLREA